MNIKKPLLFKSCPWLLLTVPFGLLAGCASPSASSHTHGSPEETQMLLESLNSRMQSMDARLNIMNERLDSTRTVIDEALTAKAKKHEKISQEDTNEDEKTNEVAPPVTQVETKTIPSNTAELEGTFVNDDATQLFRKGYLDFRSKRYPEAILVFSEFLEKTPDHPLAGNAQFYLGESYFFQREFKLALEEYSKVIHSYEYNAHVPDTLLRLAITEESLKNSEEASKYRQLLTSLFPQSPAAWEPLTSPPEPAPAENTPPEKPVPAIHTSKFHALPEPGISSEEQPFREETLVPAGGPTPAPTAAPAASAPSASSPSTALPSTTPAPKLPPEESVTETTPLTHPTAAPPTAPVIVPLTAPGEPGQFENHE